MREKDEGCAGISNKMPIPRESVSSLSQRRLEMPKVENRPPEGGKVTVIRKKESGRDGPAKIRLSTTHTLYNKQGGRGVQVFQ